MARIIQVNNYKKREKRMVRATQLLAFFQLLCLGAAFFTKGLALIPMFIILIIGSSIEKKRKNLWQFNVGREESFEALDNLPNEYTILHNVELKNNVQMLHLNHVVVGPTGVFVVKAKNWATEKVVGSVHDLNWTLYRMNHSYNEKNPIKQVKSQIHFFSSFLKENGVHVWVQGIVYLSNKASTYEIELDKLNEDSFIPVFLTAASGEELLYDYVVNYPAPKELSEETQKKIIKLLS